MALNPVTLPDALRPWHNAGLFCLLAEEAVLPSLAAPNASPAGMADAAAGAGPAQRAQQPAKPLAPQHAPQKDAAPAYAPDALPPADAPEGQGYYARQTPQTRPAGAALPPVPPNGPQNPATAQAREDAGLRKNSEARPEQDPPRPENWPAPWQALLQRSKAAPLLWTYADLGLDLSGLGAEAGAERSAALKGLIAQLRLRKGSSVFWPFALPEQTLAAPKAVPAADPEAVSGTAQPAALVPEPALFQAGLSLLQARAIIFFGPDALAKAGFNTMKGSPNAVTAAPYLQQVVAGRLLIVLPAFDSLLHDPDKTQTVLAYLRSALARVRLE